MLAEKLTILRRSLSDRLPLSLMYGDIKSPNPRADFPIPAWKSFLQMADGGTFGGNIIWTTTTLPKKAGTVRLLVSDPFQWHYIGASLDAPLMISIATEEVVMFENNSSPRTLGPVQEFADSWLMGPRYEETVPDVDDDEWWALLKEHGFA